MANIIWSSGIANAPTVELIVNQKSQDIAGNFTILEYFLILHRPYSVSSTASKAYSVSVNGVTVASGSTTIGGSGDKTIASGTVTVPHNADGTKSEVPLSFTMAIGLTWSGQATGNASGSGTMNLTTIPRASTGSLSKASPNLGEAVTINIQRPEGTSFVHDVFVDWYAGTWTKLNGTEKVATSLPWTVPKSYANDIPNSTSGNGRIKIDTYNGNTFIGSSICNFTGIVPDTAEFRPTISQVDIAEAVAGLAAQFSAFVQNRSKLVINIAADEAYGSAISFYRTTVLGSVYNGNPVTTAELTSSGEVAISVTVTDSRGRSATYSTTVNVAEYFTPEILNFNVLRATSAGVEDGDDGTYLKALMKFNVAPVGNKNTKAYTLEYKLQSATEWTTLTTGSVYTFDSSYLSTSGVLDLDFPYDIRLTIADYFGSVAQIFQMSAGFTLIDFAADGRGMAIGKVYEGLAMLELFGDMLIQNRGQDTKLLLEQLQGNAGIEVGSPSIAGTSYVDFRTGGQNTDYDARIFAFGGTGTNYQGNLGLRAGKVEIDAPNINFTNVPRVNESYLPWSMNIQRFQNIPSSNYMAIYDTNGTTYGVTIFVSDERLKENIEDFEDDGLAKILAIRHVRFDWKDGHRTEDTGYIAQQLQEIDPDFVYGVVQTDGTEMLSPDLSKIMPAVTRAIQQMNDTINTQKAAIEALEARLSALESKAEGVI